MESAGGVGGGRSTADQVQRSVQNVVVMRHGDRMDAFEPLWATHAPRPWDPPLTDGGLIRAWTTGKQLRSLGFPIHRVLVSPFLRCLQTAAQVVHALCAVEDDASLLAMVSPSQATIDPSRVKVSIEYGLCEVLGREAINATYAPKDNVWFPDVSELEALLPDGTLDHSVERIYVQLPLWEELLVDARTRYKNVIKALADQFPHENLLLVTHGEAVGVAASLFKDAEVYEVNYCAYAHLQRQISITAPEGLKADEFKNLTEDSVTGIGYLTERTAYNYYEYEPSLSTDV